MKKMLVALLIAFSTGAALADTYDELMRATKTGDVPTVAALLKKGVDPDTTDPEGNTLLILAVREGNDGLVDLLLAYKPKVNARNSAGDTALRLAAFGGRLEVVKKLVVAGARINTPGWTATLYAAYNGHIDVVRYLLQMGADINAGSDNGSTALMLAARHGNVDLVKLLLASKADPNRANDHGATALDWARRGNHDQVVQLLLAAGGKAGTP